MAKFEKKFTIPYYDCDMSAKVRPMSALKYLGEASSLHSDKLGMGADASIANNYAWILNRWRVSLDSYPKAQDKIIVETWPSRFFKFYANREFAIYDSDKMKIGKASSLWVLLDTKRGRPIRITDEIYDETNIVDEASFDEFSEISENTQMMQELQFRVRKTDIDYNNHVNNVKYLDWMLEVIPKEIEKEYILKEFEILYKKEVKYEDMIVSKISNVIKENNTIQYIHMVLDSNTGVVKTLGKTIWRKRI
nr:acyl-ACP thioesterase domain-containing protein [Tissierella sp.]